jgi:hypothetical protein
MSLIQAKNADVITGSFPVLANQGPANPAEVLKELFELLEEYGPGWYTEDLHDRAVAAMQMHGA